MKVSMVFQSLTYTPILMMMLVFDLKRCSFGSLGMEQELEKLKPVILTGDLNCAHEEIDIHNPAVSDMHFYVCFFSMIMYISYC